MEIRFGKKRRHFGVTLLVLASLLVSLFPPLSTPTASANTPLKPFPQHVTYTTGSIKPNHVTQAQMDAEVKLLYNEYKKKYIKQNPYNSNQYYVWYNDGGWNGDAITVSEAHGYGMMITALMAGHDTQAKTLFDGMYRYFRAHPSAQSPDLMAWQQANRNGAIIDINGNNSAIDGDMDIAYSLLLADKQWGSTGTINYRAEAIKVINAIMEKEVHPVHYHLQLGDWVQISGTNPDYRNATRPSDFMLQHIEEFFYATGDVRWIYVLQTTQQVVSDIFTNYTASTGLLPDFVYRDTNGKYKPVSEFTWNTPNGYFLESEFDGDYNYNSCRTPWRLGTYFLTTTSTTNKQQLTTLNNFIKNKHNEPGEVWSGYSLDGQTKLSPWDGGMDFTAPFMVSAMISSNNQQWLNDLWDYHTDASNPTALEWNYYYGNSIRLLSMIVASGNWWTP